MICPYRHKTETTLQIWTQKPDPSIDNAVTHGTNMTKVFFEDAQCLREKCGAFYNGRCHYKE